MAKKFRISDIKPIITNLAQTSHYQVIFGGLPSNLLEYLSIKNITQFFIAENAGLLCYNAYLPTSSYATRTIDGNITGIQENFAVARLYDDITLEFYIDSDYKTLIFLETWMEYISSGSNYNPNTRFPTIQQNNDGYFIKLQYPNRYKSDMTRIIKFDRDYNKEVEYTFRGLFPYSITPIQVTYNESDILKLSVTFKYDRYIFGKSYSLNYFNANQNNNEPNTIETSNNSFRIPRTGQSLGVPAGVGFISGDNLIPSPGNPVYDIAGRPISN